jgi:transposase
VGLSTGQARLGAPELRAAPAAARAARPGPLPQGEIHERGREVQRIEKTLQDAGIKLSSVASEVLGKSARLMLDALICGTHDPELLADLAKGALRKKIPALREALQGRFTGHHALLVGQMLAQIDFLDETIATLSARIEELTRPFSREIELLDTIPVSTNAPPRCCWQRSAPT